MKNGNGCGNGGKRNGNGGQAGIIMPRTRKSATKAFTGGAGTTVNGGTLGNGHTMRRTGWKSAKDGKRPD